MALNLLDKVDGAILGIDILKPEKEYPRLTEIENELEDKLNRSIKIYNINPKY